MHCVRMEEPPSDFRAANGVNPARSTRILASRVHFSPDPGISTEGCARDPRPETGFGGRIVDPRFERREKCRMESLSVATRIEQRLEIAERAVAEAQASSRSEDEFLAMLGHELRNSLSAVWNAVVCARLDCRQSGRAVDIAWRQMEQFDRLVEDLLDVTQIAQGCFRVNLQRVALTEIIEHAVEATRFLIEDRGHTLTVSLPADRVPVDGRIELLVERQDAEAVLRVRDRGIEISTNLLPRIRPLRPIGALARARASWARDRAGAKPRRAARCTESAPRSHMRRSPSTSPGLTG
jgi:signal transduction histidine kinase